MDTRTCMAESLPCSPETVKTVLIAYTPIQNLKGFKKRERTDLSKNKGMQLRQKSIFPV